MTANLFIYLILTPITNIYLEIGVLIKHTQKKSNLLKIIPNQREFILHLHVLEPILQAIYTVQYPTNTCVQSIA